MSEVQRPSLLGFSIIAHSTVVFFLSYITIHKMQQDQPTIQSQICSTINQHAEYCFFKALLKFH